MKFVKYLTILALAIQSQSIMAMKALEKKQKDVAAHVGQSSEEQDIKALVDLYNKHLTILKSAITDCSSIDKNHRKYSPERLQALQEILQKFLEVSKAFKKIEPVFSSNEASFSLFMQNKDAIDFYVKKVTTLISETQEALKSQKEESERDQEREKQRQKEREQEKEKEEKLKREKEAQERKEREQEEERERLRKEQEEKKPEQEEQAKKKEEEERKKREEEKEREPKKEKEKGKEGNLEEEIGQLSDDSTGLKLSPDHKQAMDQLSALISRSLALLEKATIETDQSTIKLLTGILLSKQDGIISKRLEAIQDDLKNTNFDLKQATSILSELKALAADAAKVSSEYKKIKRTGMDYRDRIKEAKETAYQKKYIYLRDQYDLMNKEYESLNTSAHSLLWDSVPQQKKDAFIKTAQDLKKRLDSTKTTLEFFSLDNDESMKSVRGYIDTLKGNVDTTLKSLGDLINKFN